MDPQESAAEIKKKLEQIEKIANETTNLENSWPLVVEKIEKYKKSLAEKPKNEENEKSNIPPKTSHKEAEKKNKKQEKPKTKEQPISFMNRLQQLDKEPPKVNELSHERILFEIRKHEELFMRQVLGLDAIPFSADENCRQKKKVLIARIMKNLKEIDDIKNNFNKL